MLKATRVLFHLSFLPIFLSSIAIQTSLKLKLFKSSFMFKVCPLPPKQSQMEQIYFQLNCILCIWAWKKGEENKKLRGWQPAGGLKRGAGNLMRLFTHNRDDSVRPKDKPTGARKVKLHKSNCYYPIWPLTLSVCVDYSSLKKQRKSTISLILPLLIEKYVVIGYIRRISLKTLE